MKLRHPGLLKALGFVLSGILRLWIGTLRYQFHSLGREEIRPDEPGVSGHYIYAFWHENMLLLAYHYGRPDVYVLISQHADGQLIAEICEHMGFGLVRGSTTRGGVEAVRRILRLGQAAHLAVTPDGPRGPRRHVQPGLIYLASRTGMPIVPAGIGYGRPWRLKSWDRFALPRPFSAATCIVADSVRVPADIDKDQLEHYRTQVQDAMLRVTDLAERWAKEGGRWSAFPRSEDSPKSQVARKQAG